MDLIHNLVLGFSVALAPSNLLYCFLGALLGTLIGILPGVGPTATIAMLLPLTFALPPDSALIMLAGIYYGAQYGGSTTAILVNLPGEASSAITAIDGYQMARKGRAGAALAIAAIGSFIAGTFATLLIAVAAGPMSKLALQFGPAEYFSLIVLGLVCSVALAHGSVVKAIAMILFGLALGLVGTDIYTGAARFNFGTMRLADGLNFVAIAVGLYGVAEILRNLETGMAQGNVTAAIGRLMPSHEEFCQSTGPIWRGTLIGSFLGVLPGGGAMLSSFASYVVEKKLSRHPETFGQGAIEGVAGPESANNAGAQTSFIPMLTMGIPSNAVMALMIGAMIIQGVVPGPQVITRNPDLFWGLIVSMWAGNAMLLVLNLPLIGLWLKLLKAPYWVLFPAIVIFSSIGIFVMSGNPFDLFAVAIFGALGYFLQRAGCEPTPLLLGFVLGPMLEEHLRRAMLLSRGDPTIFLARPLSAVILVFAAALLVLVALPAISRKRDEVFVEEE